jgi:hypothetical protein
MRFWHFKVWALPLGAAICITVLLGGLLLTKALPPHGVVYGSVHRCDMSPIVRGDACSSRREYEPVAGANLEFVRTDDNDVFVAVTDSAGNYSISLSAGHYRMQDYVDGGPRELTVISGQRIEADYQVWRLPQ